RAHRRPVALLPPRARRPDLHRHARRRGTGGSGRPHRRPHRRRRADRARRRRRRLRTKENAMSTLDTDTESARAARRLRTVTWIVALATFGLVFDGYDLVGYGAVVPTFLPAPSHIGPVTPAVAGLLGSYALVGVMVGALLAGAVGDILGR